MTDRKMPDTTPAGARALYTLMYEDDRYRMGNSRRAIAEPILKKEVERVIEQMPVERQGFAITYLDVACGRGEMIDYVDSLPGGVVTGGLEIVPSLGRDDVEIIDTLLSIPDDDREHHLVSCYDVLEHLAEVDMIAAITELWRITHTTLIIAVSCVASGSFGAGIELHPTQQQPGWWRDRIQEACFVAPELVHKTEGRVLDRVRGKAVTGYTSATFVVRRAGE
jgi:hypothetical protein